MPRIKYGPVANCGAYVTERTFANGSVFVEHGALFCNLNTSGLVDAAAAADSGLWGWALLGFSPEAPRVDETGTYGQLVLTTVTNDKFKVYQGDTTTVYHVPADTAWVLATHQGEDCDLAVSSNRQLADLGTSSTNVLRVIDGVASVSEAWVMINTLTVAQA